MDELEVLEVLYRIWRSTTKVLYRSWRYWKYYIESGEELQRYYIGAIGTGGTI